jgi:hypothetical protein
MTDLMIAENNLTFKDIEKYFFDLVCESCQELTKKLLEDYDALLSKERDKSLYRNKGRKKTVIKTIYGPVEYKRTIYLYKHEAIKEYVYLLDKALDLGKTGFISTNLASLMIQSITNQSYRGAATQVSRSTGQNISAMGLWGIIQKSGEQLILEEEKLVDSYKTEKLQGEIETPVLFEEIDGVYINLQGKDKEAIKGQKAEMKVGISYTGWAQTAKDRYNLKNKEITVGFYKNGEFHITREAKIANKYNLDEVTTRVLNGDGAKWIKDVIDKETIIQLDPFHRNKAIREKIHDEDAQIDILNFLYNKDITGLFNYLDSYKNSICDDKEIEDAQTLITYFNNNKEGLIPFQSRGIKLPDSKDGTVYRNLGTMEANIWLIVAKRMKHNHTCWSKSGANHLVKIIAKKCTNALEEVIERLNKPIVNECQSKKLFEEVFLSATESVEVVGHGYEYPVQGHVLL